MFKSILRAAVMSAAVAIGRKGWESYQQRKREEEAAARRKPWNRGRRPTRR
jgi:hypothetical protein